MGNTIAPWAIAGVALLWMASLADLHAPRADAALACTPGEDESALQAARPAPDSREALLAEHIARRFFIAPSETQRFVTAAFRAARESGLDPLLVLAVIAVESRFNPIAQSMSGAKGLMQIIPRYHRDKLERFGGEAAALQPESNIAVGVRILEEYVREAGSLEAGLRRYNGSSSEAYAQKVLTERDRLEAMLREAANRAAQA